MAMKSGDAEWKPFETRQQGVPRVGHPVSTYALKCPHCSKLIIMSLSKEHDPKVADEATLDLIKDKVGAALGIQKYSAPKEKRP